MIMPRRLSARQLATMCLTGLLAVGAAQGDGYIKQREMYVTPSNLVHVQDKPDKFHVKVGCFGVYWGTPIDCSFSLWVSYPHPTSPPWLANGGHYHDADTRPLIYRQRHFVGNELYYDGAGSLDYPSDIDPDPMAVQGETFPGVPYADYAIVAYPIPEVSGEVQMDTRITILSPYWYCASDCYTAKMFWFQDLFHIGVQGLVEVPDPGLSGHHYIKSRTAEAEHPNAVAFNIKPEHLTQLYKIADEYYTAFQTDKIYQETHGVPRPLSLNDMTLPLGGLFDIRHDWAPPHRSHRDGTDADVNRKVNNVIIECSLKDRHLIEILRGVLPNVKHTAPGDTNSALLCEKTWSRSQGKYIYLYHIDFEM
jgi:hypothetical protein